MKRVLLPALLLFYFGISALAQRKNVSAGPVPAWIKNYTYDATATSMEKQAEDGAINLLYTDEINIAEKTEYQHHAIKILSESGVENNSEVTVTFDPLYEKVIFHHISIIRGGQVINKLNLPKLKLVSIEEDRSKLMYNGQLDAINILEDVRKGDIIDYDYTLVGFNPIFNDKYASFFTTAFSVPVYEMHYYILSPKNRTLQVKTFNEKQSPTVTAIGTNNVYEWNAVNVKPFKAQDKTPAWYDPYPTFMISDYSSWNEVASWATHMFPINAKISPALKEEINRIEKQSATTEQKIQAALRFVQDEIRYMAFEMGEHSHKPSEPSKVLAQRFGDCKEKSYLLCTMLHAMGIEAQPVLINTDYKKTLLQWLPAFTNFDHVVARVLVNNAWMYFDPTISYQRGALKDIFFPDYQVGLPVSDTTTALAIIPFKNNSIVTVRNKFSSDAMYGEGKLKIVTVNKGSYADDARYNFKSNSVSSIQADYKKFYASPFPEIIADSLDYTDNDSTGVFTTTEYYTLPKFWEKEKGGLAISFWPFYTESMLVSPDDKSRTMPIGIKYPCHVKEYVEVSLPDTWNFTASSLHLANKSFKYDLEISGLSDKAFAEISLENLRDYVPENEAKQYMAAIDSIYDHSSYELTYNQTDDKKEVDKTGNGKKTNPFFIAMLILAIVVGVVVWSQRNR